MRREKNLPLKSWILRGVLLLAAPLVVAVTAATAYMGSVLQSQVADSNALTLAVYMREFDANLSSLDTYLRTLPTLSGEISTLALSQDRSSRYLAVRSLNNELKKSMPVYYDHISGLFIYSDNPYQPEFIYELGGVTSVPQTQALTDWVKSQENLESTAGWELAEIGGYRFLVDIQKNGSTYSGAWMQAETLALPFQNMDLGEGGRVLFADADGNILAQTGPDGPVRLKLPLANGATLSLNGGRYIASGLSAANAPLTLLALVPSGTVSKGIWPVLLVILLIFLVALAAVPILGRRFSRKVSAPLGSLLATMEAPVEELAHADEAGSFAEFNLIARHLNEMLARIRQLQHDVYERTIHTQKIQLQYLQMQIRPHFFMNALNIIYSFTQTKNYELVQRMTLCLVRHFRYMLRSGDGFVTIENECEHVRNYMEIQQLRYSGTFEYRHELEESLTACLLPPLVIQTFVENAIKYALEENRVNTILLSIHRQERDGTPGMRIMVSDNGRGYPPEVLSALAQGQPPPPGAGTGLGITNVRQRLELVYGSRFRLDFHNEAEGGAVVSLWLPLEPPENGPEDLPNGKELGGGTA